MWLTHVSRQGLLCAIRAEQSRAEHTISEPRVALRNQSRAEHSWMIDPRAEQSRAEQSIHPWMICVPTLPEQSRAEHPWMDDLCLYPPRAEQSIHP